ncbi:MAG TPA: response regulator transcription factor [Terriglobia bacterium]|nr:response regulator transcription factor [Terriglobia bacterium]
MRPNMISVLIKASSSTVKARLEALVRSEAALSIVNDHEPGEGSVGHLQPDVILAAVESPDDETATDVLEDAVGPTPVILLVRGSISEWSDAFQRGARAVLPGNITATQIVAAIEAAVAGLAVVRPGDIDKLLFPPRVDRTPEALPEALTLREVEVLRLLADGLANKEIAARLAISEHTVKFHVASIMGKLGAGSRTEAVTIGIRRGLVLI